MRISWLIDKSQLSNLKYNLCVLNYLIIINIYLYNLVSFLIFSLLCFVANLFFEPKV